MIFGSKIVGLIFQAHWESICKTVNTLNAIAKFQINNLEKNASKGTRVDRNVHLAYWAGLEDGRINSRSNLSIIFKKYYTPFVSRNINNSKNIFLKNDPLYRL